MAFHRIAAPPGGVTSLSDIDCGLVLRLLRAQFPHWSALPVTRIVPGGWDNVSFRLGDDKLVRMPRSAAYALQVEKEQHWLPILAPALPLPIPEPLALGRPSCDNPWHWSIYRWLDGDTAEGVSDWTNLAGSIAAFLKALHWVDSTGGPVPGPHNCYRGGPLGHYDGEVRAAVAQLGGQVDAARVLRIGNRAAATRWQREPVWIHGDLSPGNLLLREGALAAVIDFGCCGVGDPACDLAIAWSAFDEPARVAFREALPLDAATWRRGRGWALWKSLITLAAPASARTGAAARALAHILADDDQEGERS